MGCPLPIRKLTTSPPSPSPLKNHNIRAWTHMDRYISVLHIHVQSGGNTRVERGGHTRVQLVRVSDTWYDETIRNKLKFMHYKNSQVKSTKFRFPGDLTHLRVSVTRDMCLNDTNKCQTDSKSEGKSHHFKLVSGSALTVNGSGSWEPRSGSMT